MLSRYLRIVLVVSPQTRDRITLAAETVDEPIDLFIERAAEQRANDVISAELANNQTIREEK